ncbi:MAG TPA: VWA-like domain-containing protein [Kineosporiaceae bacterium]|nr:VWA-like domain-containing protein [Kineosporiaceae bacterium]
MTEPGALDLVKLLAARYRAARARPYLAGALFAMTVVSSPTVLTMGVDRYWRCYASPAFVDATDIDELAGVWLHEVAHLLRDHHTRARRLFEQSRADAAAGRPSQLDPQHPEREQLRLNLAMDCEINDDVCAGLDAASGVRLPPWAVTASGLGLSTKEPLFEQYLHHLTAAFACGRLAWLDCGSGAHDGQPAWELDGTGANPLSPAQAAAIRYRVAEQIRRGIGNAPRGWQRWAEDISQPVQDWRRLLQATLRHSLAQVSGAVDYAYRRPGRRAAALSGTVIMPSLLKPLPTIAIVIDTSGSVADSELGIALGETAGILKAVGAKGNRISVYSCDAAVHTVQEVCDTAQINLAGGGGTDLRQGIRRAQEHTPRPDIIVVITDGHTPWPSERPAGRVIVGLLGPPPALDEFGVWHPLRPPQWAETVHLR